MSLKLCLCAVALIQLTTADDLLSFIDKCDWDDTQIKEVNQCVLKEARRVQQIFMHGLPEYGVDSMDPLLLGVLTPAKGIITTVQQKMTRLQGLSKMHIENIKFNANGMSELILHGDLLVTSDFDGEVSVEILSLMSGSGKFTVNLNDVTIRMKFYSSKVVDQKQKEYFHIDDAVTNMDIGHFDFDVTHLTGSFASAESLIKLKVKLFESYYVSVFGKPSIDGATTAIVKNLNKLFSRIPIEDLFEVWPEIDERRYH